MDLLIGRVVKIDNAVYYVKGTDRGTLWAVLTNDGRLAQLAMLGDTCLADVPASSLLPAAEKELADYTDQNWGIVEPLNPEWQRK